jgi:3-hydroxyisobutyrate dehydrogenase-like beta-hydroxyacid dehydrogenase
MQSTRIGFIGLGAMGRPMAEQILGKHGSLGVYDVDQGAVEALVAQGAVAAATPQALGQRSDVVITMLPHPDVLETVALGTDGLVHGMAAGATLIDMSTNGLEAVRAVGAALAERGIKMVDAPVGKGPWAAEKGDLTILMGGAAADCRAVEWVVGMMGSKTYYCGPLGAGQVVKLANNLASCANMAVLAEAYALAKAGGADLAVLAEVMPQTSADSWQLRQTLNGKVLKGDFSPMFKLALALKDMRLIVAMAEALGSPIGCGKATLDWYAKGAKAGHGELDWGAIMLTANPELAGE